MNTTMKQLFLIVMLLANVKNFYGQHIFNGASDTFSIDTLYTSSDSRGDMINISVSNYAEEGRQFVVDVITLEEGYWGTIYSASINDDSYFFKQYRNAKKLSQKTNVKFILPGYGKIHYDIDSDEAKDLGFKITGKPLQKGVAAQLSITLLNTNEVIYSPVFYIYKQPE